MKNKIIFLIFFHSVIVHASNNHIAECDKFGLRDSLSCYSYIECRNNGGDVKKCAGGRFSNEMAQDMKTTQSKLKKDTPKKKDLLSDEEVSISDRLKADAIAQEKRNKERQGAEKKRTEELIRQQAIQQQRCVGPHSQPGCPNYQPRYDKNGKIIY
jgi:hypothetical protein